MNKVIVLFALPVIVLLSGCTTHEYRYNISQGIFSCWTDEYKKLPDGSIEFIDQDGDHMTLHSGYAICEYKH